MQVEPDQDEKEPEGKEPEPTTHACKANPPAKKQPPSHVGRGPGVVPGPLWRIEELADAYCYIAAGL
jgi:hypothetical protein